MKLLKQKGFALVELFIFLFVTAVFLLGSIGWVLNISKIFELLTEDSGISGLLLLRALGIVFPPLGAVLGYFG